MEEGGKREAEWTLKVTSKTQVLVHGFKSQKLALFWDEGR
jgi:hypothetical protein